MDNLTYLLSFWAKALVEPELWLPPELWAAILTAARVSLREEEVLGKFLYAAKEGKGRGGTEGDARRGRIRISAVPSLFVITIYY